ncbi:hypothetical protein AVKW3434_07695 [Acidovorax sp. SUPP3434]|nr:hypothetical protein AVKW3434_07695 [Acidovorax sp. SUPP3434]
MDYRVVPGDQHVYITAMAVGFVVLGVASGL